MATVAKKIQESISKDAIIADLEIQISTAQAQITDYEKIIAATDPVLGATLISRQIENKLKEIEDLVRKKQAVSDKPLSDFEKAELAGSYQRRIESIEKEKAELETLKGKLA